MVKHFSHRHELCWYQVQEEDEMSICSGCELHLICSSSAYKCSKSKCEFYLHDLCFELPQQIHHKSHPKHPLTLSTPPYQDGDFTCDACAGFGSSFTFHCINCKYDLHVQCATLPETVTHPHHPHPLALIYSLPAQNYIICDFCYGAFPAEGCWVYYCKHCHYTTHLDCSITQASEPEAHPSSS